MTNTVLSATLFGAEDLRMVDAPLSRLAPGMVRVRFGAGGICGSDMHYFRHGRTGDFIVESPLVLGHEIAGEVVEIAGEAPGLTVGDRVAVNPSQMVRPLRALPGRTAEPLREHLFHGIGIEEAAHAGRLRHIFRRHPGSMRQGVGRTPFAAAALAEPLAVCLHAVNAGRRGRRASGASSSAPVRSAF